MLTKFKKSFTIALAVVMCLSTVCASAASWRIADYDTTTISGGQCDIVYAEYDDMGNFTGRSVQGAAAVAFGLKPKATVEHKNPWMDIYFPNREYATVYADGKNLGVFAQTGNAGKATNPFTGDLVDTGLVEYKDVDFMWQVAAPFGIYSVTKAKLNIGGQVQWFGTPAYNYPTQYTGRNANVDVQRVAYGFADYEITGANKVELIPDDLDGVRNDLTGSLVPTVSTGVSYVNNAIYANTGLTLFGGGTASLAPIATATNLPVSPAPIQILASQTWQASITVPRSYDYALVGPAYDELGNEIARGTTITASTYQEGRTPHRAVELASFGVANLIDTVADLAGNVQNCEITWTAGGYDINSPHNVYEYLTIDGVVMDGSYIAEVDGIHYWRPCIIAYTGAVAMPW